jgi:hypothetical protein
MITFRLSEDDFLNGSLLAIRWERKTWLITAATVVLLLALGTFMLLPNSSPDIPAYGWSLIGGTVGSCVGVALTRYLFFPIRLKSRFAERKALHIESTLSRSQEGLTIENVKGHGLVPWSQFIKTRENEIFVLLYTSQAKYLIFPKRFFADPGQLGSFVDLVHERIGVRLHNRVDDPTAKVV